MKNGAPKLQKTVLSSFFKVNKVSSAEMSRNSSINKSFKLLKFHFASNFGFNYFLLCSNKYSQESDWRSIEKSLYFRFEDGFSFQILFVFTYPTRISYYSLNQSYINNISKYLKAKFL